MAGAGFVVVFLGLYLVLADDSELAEPGPDSEPQRREVETSDHTSQPPASTTTMVPDWILRLEAGLQEYESARSRRSSNTSTFDATVAPGDSIQATVEELPPGSTVLIQAGIHLGQQIRPKTGMTFVGEPGAVLDGEGSTGYAFVAFEEDDADDVTIRGLEIRNYRPDFEEHGAIHSNRRSGWIVEQCRVHDTAFAGIYVGSNSIVRNCHVHDNGRIGLKATGENVVVANNEISDNNANNDHDPGFEAGGFKFVETNGLIVHENYFHGNVGPGIWADVDSKNTLIQDNVVEDNTYAGIDYEISSHAVIRGNQVRFNGLGHPGGWMWGAGITIRGPHVHIHENVVEGNRNGIALIQTGRGSGAIGSYDLGHIVVRDNLVINSGQTGAVRSGGAGDIFDTSTFQGNEYRYNEIEGDWWRWDNTVMTVDQWTSTGNDVDGKFGA